MSTTNEEKAHRLVGFYNWLLAMTNEQKTALMQDIGATRKAMSPRQKTDAMAALDALSDGLLESIEQRYIALDIVREPTRVICFAKALKSLGVPSGEVRRIKCELGAKYLALTSSPNGQKKVDEILERIGREYEALTTSARP
jgi:hypothetical protein